MRVLVLSKYAIVRTALRHMLSSAADIEVVAEADLHADVHHILRTTRPDVVLIEIEARDSAMAPVVQKIGHCEKVNLVVLAGEAEPGLVRAMLRSGVAAYVLKQSTDTELLVALRSAARGRRFLDSSLIDAITFNETTTSAGETGKLSKRQSEVLNYLIQGYTSGETAGKLGVSTKTVETYRARIYDKLEVRSRSGLIQYAISTGMISIHARAKP